MRSASAPFPDREGIARPGWNCRTLDVADRFGVLVDAEAYFRALADTLPLARRSIRILGWEFDSRTALLRGDATNGRTLPLRIGPLLDALVRRNPRLTVQVLIWDSPLIYAFSREFGGLVKMDWLTHPRLSFRLDDGHPLGGSHHQKIVVIDDALAFSGGLDITSQRWDTRLHLAEDPRRCDPSFPDYPPFHDIMAVVDGAAARALGDLCRARWRAVTGEAVPPCPPPGETPPWPPDLPPLATRIEVALSRTCPAWDGAPPVREVERLFLDMITGARRLLFFENQYLTARRIADALAARLAQPDCPEIVAIGPGEPANLMERSSMEVARAAVLHRLRAADRYGRFDLYMPVVGDVAIKVHSKVMVVDDRVLRIGSANLNNRSLGLDGECDLTVEAGGDAGREAAFRRFRHDLLAEHLDVAPERLAACETAGGSLHAAIAVLAQGTRRLVRHPGAPPADVLPLITHCGFPDPEAPMEDLVWAPDAPSRRALLRLRLLLSALAAVAVAASLWRWAPVEAWRAVAPLLGLIAALHANPAAAAAAAAGIALATLVRLPLPPLAFAAAAVLGPWTAMAAALAGGLAGAMIHYLLGRALGRRLAGSAIRRVAAALVRHGLAAIVLLRLMPASAFVVTNMVAGAARIRVGDFVLGSLLGMAPVLFAMSVLGDRALAVLRNPSLANIAVLGLATALVAGAAAGLAGRLGRASASRPK